MDNNSYTHIFEDVLQSLNRNNHNFIDNYWIANGSIGVNSDFLFSGREKCTLNIIIELEKLLFPKPQYQVSAYGWIIPKIFENPLNK